MDLTENIDVDSLIANLPGEDGQGAKNANGRGGKGFSQMMRKIPVTLTLEVGSARISLQELMDIQNDSVLELDTFAGDPLVIKVNGTPIGRAEVVVTGENYGLKVVELADLDLDMLDR
jgi:flagellar motor switch protein FliN/FliY